MSNHIIVPSGYMGSGSSAVTNLISEFDGFHINKGEFEYVFLHCPNGLFDLEDKLLRGNNALRSDEAVHSFLRYMTKLHRNGYWFSGYGEKISPRFLEHCQAFIQALNPTVITNIGWYYLDNIDTLSNKLKWYARRAIAKLTNQTELNGKPLKPRDYYDVTLVYPGKDKFYAAAREFLENLFSEMGREDHHLVLDQFLLPHNLHRIDHYFDDDLRVIVVDRDPRDIFIANKCFWLPQGWPIPYPTDAGEFCRVFKGIRECEQPINDRRILRLSFEDLIYNYDQTCRRLYDFLGVSETQHFARKGTLFQPERSINNTQLFRRKEADPEDIRIIENNLREYLYDFPEESNLPSPDGEVF